MPLSSIADSTKQQLAIDVLNTHGRCRLQVCGTSMLPTLWPGETVLIERRAFLEPGDIVLYERAGRFFLHRLVNLRPELPENQMRTRGDSLPQGDAAVSSQCLLGVLAGVRRDDKWVAVPQRMPMASRIAAFLLSRSSLLVRLVLRVRLREDSATNRTVLPEVSAS